MTRNKIEDLKEIKEWLLRGDREKLAVWIGKNGCAVHGGDSYCLPVSNVMAHQFISRHRLKEIERRPDGIAFAA